MPHSQQQQWKQPLVLFLNSEPISTVSTSTPIFAPCSSITGAEFDFCPRVLRVTAAPNALSFTTPCAAAAAAVSDKPSIDCDPSIDGDICAEKKGELSTI